MATVAFFHAHPDDEAIATGGTMAKLAAHGHRVVLVTATGGELGEVPEGILEAGESLAERRREELARACSLLGVARHELLGYLDSGMEGEASNADPSCFWQADVDSAAARLEDLIREEGVDVLVTYDERGVYGHPDHVQVHRVGMRAAELAGTSRVFMATVNRDHLRALAQRTEWLGAVPPEAAADFEDRREAIESLGVEASRITTAVDVRGFVAAKRGAMAAHASQISDTSFFLAMPPDVFQAVWGTEWYIRAGAVPGETMESSLLEESN